MSAKGPLKKNEIGRFEFDDYELTCGDAVEVLLSGHWIRCSVEASNGVYALFPNGGGGFIPLNGLMARVPGFTEMEVR